MSKILIITTGGTIAMRKDSSGNVIPGEDGGEVLVALASLRGKQGGVQWSVCNFSNMASCNMSPSKMRELALVIEKAFGDPDIQGVIVTHGTDTLEETAYFLDLTISDNRAIVLTAAQRDASAQDADGPRNLVQAASVVLDQKARGQGVLVCFNEDVFTARGVSKVHTSQVNAFSGGEIAQIDGEEVAWNRRAAQSVKLAIPERIAKIPLIKMYTGAEEGDFKFLEHMEIDAVVLEAFGRGNIPPEVVPVFERVVQRGVPVAVASRCLKGNTAPVYGYPGGGADLECRGFWFVRDLPAEKARILLSVAFGLGYSHSFVRELLADGGLS